jgi:primosomal protein N' (replication factor Y)
VGRSGRGERKGMAVIQSYTPDNLIISMAAKQDYDTFFDTEIKIREAML